MNEENGARGGQQYAIDHASEMNRWAIVISGYPNLCILSVIANIGSPYS